MTITIQPHPDGETTDITKYLSEESDAILTEEIERDGFERVIDDVSLEFNNMDGFFSAYFDDATASQLYRVVINIPEDSKTWAGFVDNKSIRGLVVDEMFTMDVFSVNKEFWNRAGEMYVDDLVYEHIYYRTLTEMLRNHILRDSFSDLFDDEYEVDSVFAGRNIRGWADTYRRSRATLNRTPLQLGIFMHGFQTGDLVDVQEVENYPEVHGLYTVTVLNDSEFTLDGTSAKANETISGGYVAKYSMKDIGDSGRFRELAKDTTVAELLEAFAMKLNAAIYVDGARKKFVMIPRGKTVSETVHEIGSELLDEEEIQITIVDDQKYDYVLTPYYLTPSEPPYTYDSGIFPLPGIGYGFNGIVEYVITDVYSGMESGPSQILRVDLRDRPEGSLWGITVVIPAAADSGHVTERRLYRRCTQVKPSEFYFLAFNPGSDSFSYVDMRPDQVDPIIKAPAANALVRAWWSFDESQGFWNYPPIIDVVGGSKQPKGRVFNTIPKLRFSSVTNREDFHDATDFDIWCFFGREGHIDRDNFFYVQNQYTDLVVNKVGVSLGLKGRKYSFGDKARFKANINSSKVSGKEFVIQKAIVNIHQEKTRVNLVEKVV